MYVVAVKIPKTIMKSVKKGTITLTHHMINITRNRKSKISSIEMPEKQGKKLLQECYYDFKKIADMLSVTYGNLTIQGFDKIMRYGLS